MTRTAQANFQTNAPPRRNAAPRPTARNAPAQTPARAPAANGTHRTIGAHATPSDISTARIALALGRRALSALGHLPASASKAVPQLIFCANRTNNTWTVSPILTDPATGTERPLADPAAITWTHDTSNDLWHVESDDLRATIDRTNGAPRLLFVTSPILARLGLAGGRYEPIGVTLS